MSTPLEIAKLLVPQIPNLTVAAINHSLGRNQTSSKWTLRMTIGVEILRKMVRNADTSKSLAATQAVTLRDSGIPSNVWVAKDTFPVPETNNLCEATYDAIQALKTTPEELKLSQTPNLKPVQVEWTTPSWTGKPLPEGFSESDKFAKLHNTPEPMVILYFHGGAYYLCDPCTHRGFVAKLASPSNAIVCSVRYRLAPQSAFPEQLLDALLAYLTLLHPPKGSLHDAIPPSRIVFAGDSAGGNLVFALLQLLLQFQRTGTKVRFGEGEGSPIPLPAGASANSGWFDIARALPSGARNADWDFLPLPNHDGDINSRPSQPNEEERPGKAQIWPTNPPRGDLFCDLELLDHPLVSPTAAADWKGAPPMYHCVGEEMLEDDIRTLAKRAAEQGVAVQLDAFEAMPHCFALTAPDGTPLANVCMDSWARFCARPGHEGCRGRFWDVKSRSKEFDVATCTDLTVEKARKYMNEVKVRRIKAFREGRTSGMGL
ncbi:lipase/esterase [Piedraia hortae CBS 480.64]|uniref:Lipase/esterase n=1 Tax=Piedraia hortae CBS 480.64 TaxID=1314780 RepID=A0A6A7C8X5_9PEZI|nr:lipase/esterase [Piedraia hortae CBS 480.64]